MREDCEFLLSHFLSQISMRECRELSPHESSHLSCASSWLPCKLALITLLSSLFRVSTHCCCLFVAVRASYKSTFCLKVKPVTMQHRRHKLNACIKSVWSHASRGRLVLLHHWKCIELTGALGVVQIMMQLFLTFGFTHQWCKPLMWWKINENPASHNSN